MSEVKISKRARVAGDIESLRYYMKLEGAPIQALDKRSTLGPTISGHFARDCQDFEEAVRMYRKSGKTKDWKECCIVIQRTSRRHHLLSSIPRERWTASGLDLGTDYAKASATFRHLNFEEVYFRNPGGLDLAGRIVRRVFKMEVYGRRLLAHNKPRRRISMMTPSNRIENRFEEALSEYKRYTKRFPGASVKQYSRLKRCWKWVAEMRKEYEEEVEAARSVLPEEVYRRFVFRRFW